MALRTSENDDSELNPGQSDYDRKFNNASVINKTETAGTVDNSDKNDKTSTDGVRDAEENPDDGWKTNVSNDGSSSSKSGGRFSFFKKKGPLTTIIITLVGGSLGIGGLLSPGLLLLHFKETMVQKFNGQLTSMDIRTNKILKSKALGGVGVCGAVVNIKCKYSSMSDAQIKKFKKAGIDVKIDADASKSLLGRKKVNNFVFDGEDVSPSQFTKKLNTDAKFRAGVKKAYNPLLAGFTDSIWNKAILKLSISKKGIKLEGVTDKEKLAGIQADTKSPVTINEKAPKGSDVDASNKPLYPGGENSDAFKKAKGDFDVLKKSANDVVGKSAGELAGEAAGSAEVAVKSVTKSTVGALFSSVKITGAVDDLCTIYGTTRAIGFAAKTVRAMQLARYAMLFLTIADQIKAGGNPAPEDVSYLGSVLTAETKSLGPDGKTMVSKTATDSYGYKYAAYGEVGAKMPDTAAQFLAGGGLTGTLMGVTSVVNQMLGKNPDRVCKINNNIAVQIGSAAVGATAAFFSGGITLTVGGAFKIVGAAAFSVALIYLPALLKDAVAGVVVDSSTVGELAGDAITSGSSGMMGTVASLGGNAPLTIPQAVAYQNLSKKVIAQYAEEDRLAYSPLDVSNKNTFMGSVFSKLVPQLVKMSSTSGYLSSISSIISTSFSSIIPITKAADANEYSICQDYDYKSMDLAADPYCNLAYGIPPDNLQGIEPLEVLDKMNGEIDQETGLPLPGSGYQKFVDTCVNRANPIGYTGDDYSEDSGINCLINDSNPMNKYYYLYQIDQRVERGMDNEEIAATTAADDSGSGSSATDTTDFDSKTMKQLAKSIIDSGNVNDRTGQIKQFAAGTRTDINIKVLKIVAELAEKNKFTVSDLVRSKNASYGAKNSQHKIGLAVDFSGSVGINGVPMPNYSNYSKTIQTFVNEAAQLLGDSCNQIGVPNIKYRDNAPKSKCDIFFDPGTGTHIHIGVKA